jgi:hypothetical protein
MPAAGIVLVDARMNGVAVRLPPTMTADFIFAKKRG